MLLEFKVSNYRSIGEEQVLSLVPAPKQKDFVENIISINNYESLNAIAFYGPNGSGKTNILQSMSLMDKIVHISARMPSTTQLPHDPFLLREGWADKPTAFEITFITNDIRYRYGFKFNRSEVLEEWLFRKVVGREVVVFEREKDIIEVSSGFKGAKPIIEAAIEATRDNALFLSTCDMFNVEEAKTIFQWFHHFKMIDGLNTEQETITTAKMWQEKEYQDKIRNYIAALDLEIVDMDMASKKFDEGDLPEDIPEGLRGELAKAFKGQPGYAFLAKHRVYDKKATPTKQTREWRWSERESSGANKALQLSGPVLWALANGGVLIIDEIEAKMHPIMTLHTIEAFINKKSNPNNAQLIFATHDTNLLTYGNLRRDQIYFAEKNKWESTEIYSLSDFVYFGERDGKVISEKERPDTDKQKRYIEGRYGAIPVLGDLSNFLK